MTKPVHITLDTLYQQVAQRIAQGYITHGVCRLDAQAAFRATMHEGPFGTTLLKTPSGVSVMVEIVGGAA